MRFSYRSFSEVLLWLEVCLLLFEEEEELDELGERRVDALLRVLFDLDHEGDGDKAEDVFAVQVAEHAHVLEEQALVRDFAVVFEVVKHLGVVSVLSVQFEAEVLRKRLPPKVKLLVAIRQLLPPRPLGKNAPH